tara:strand:- start:1158 stop:2165 length:1008 start_codon:yes stop_codon:yes gene_type:complete
MEFEEKVLLTKKLFTEVFNGNIEVIETNPKFRKNYRNKSDFDMKQDISPESRIVLSKTHLKILEFLKSLNTSIISVTIKHNYHQEYQIKFIISLNLVMNLNYLIDIIEKIKKEMNINIISGYYQIKYPEKPKPNKTDLYYHFYGDLKLKEIMDGNIIELSPNSFCRINYHISRFLYHRIFLLVRYITNNFDRNLNLICFGRDINFPIEYYHSYFNSIMAITHCPIVYSDCKPKKNVELILADKKEYPDKFDNYFKKNKGQNYVILVTAGRNGLATDLWENLTQHKQVKHIIYSACGRSSLARNMNENKKMKIKNVIIMDEFPNTYSSNSIVQFSQ